MLEIAQTSLRILGSDIFNQLTQKLISDGKECNK